MQRAILYGAQTAFKIMSTNEPGEHKKLGGQIKGFKPLIWGEMKLKIMNIGLHAPH